MQELPPICQPTQQRTPTASDFNLTQNAVFAQKSFFEGFFQYLRLHQPSQVPWPTSTESQALSKDSTIMYQMFTVNKLETRNLGCAWLRFVH